MGKKKIIVSERDNIAALFEDDRAIEFIIHRGDMLLGDVYLATVENILPSIDAAFVNVGGDKMGFLHSSDVKGRGDLQDRIKPKQKLVVQVMKEPTGHKGPRVTTNISLPGRFLVLMPESKGISISRKIDEQKERSRLKAITSMVKPAGVGLIIRTEANHQKESDIQEDFETLLDRWQNIVASADTAQPPSLLHRDQDLLYRVIREIVTEDVVEIMVDTAFGQQRAQQLLQNWNMDKGVKVTLHNGNQSILIGQGVDREIKLALQTKVPLPSGGYLYIQPTEALTVVDVNSGKFTSLKSQAETIRRTNLEACKEIARQLRLRNIGGMIIVDFIDMESRADQLSVLESFENELAPDKSKPQMGQLTDLGLVEMTRHRQGQALSEIFTHSCGACDGTGHAIEDFNWAPPNIDGEIRNVRPSRGNLPIRSYRGRDRNDRGDRGRGGRDRRDDRQQREPITPGSILIRQSDSGNGDRPKRPYQPFDEFFKEKTFKEFGVRLADAVKIARNPIQANSILARINPRANDILTLIQSIESGESPIPMDRHYRHGSRYRDEEAGRRRHHGQNDSGDEEDEDDEDRRQDFDSVESQEKPREDSPEESEAKTTEDSDKDTKSNGDERRKPRRGRPPRQSTRRSEVVDETAENALSAEAEDDSETETSSSSDEKPKRRRGRPPKRARVSAKSD